MQEPSRIDVAKRRLRLTRYGIGVAAALGFAGAGLAVRAAHPGHASAGTSGSGAQAAMPASAFGAPQSQSDGSFFGDGGSSGGSISPPSQGAPSVQSGGS